MVKRTPRRWSPNFFRRIGLCLCILFWWSAFCWMPFVWALEDSRNPEDWYQRATEDLEIAELLHSNQEYSGNVCFHAHQAIEKLFKGVLIHNGLSPERTHRTADLAKDLSRFYQGLREHIGACSDIDALYVPGRYPKKGMGPLTREDGEVCLKTARGVFGFLQGSENP